MSMKLKASELRKMIKEEFSRSIPDFALRQMAEVCSEDFKRLMINHINTKSQSQSERQHMVVQANKIAEEIEKEVKDLLDSKLSDFLNRSSR